MQVTRRGFLSFCLSVPIIAKLPILAEPIVTRQVLPVRPPIHPTEAGRYVLTCSGEARVTPPGCIALVKAQPKVIFKPHRMIMNVHGFELLHLTTGGEPILEDSIPCEFFSPLGFGTRLEFAAMTPDDEVVVAAINLSDEEQAFRVSLVGAALYT